MRKMKLLRLTTVVVALLLLVNQTFAQNRTISGTVTDQDGKGVPGVTVTVKGTNNATQTDANGTYRISAPENGTLVFSSVGYGSSEVQTGSRTSVNASLTSTNDNLSEVVVIGYGTARRKDLTGSVATVNEKNFNKGTYTSPDQLIQGKVAGVQLINNSGQPGSATTIKIRGNSTVTGTGQPLFVVDGVPLDGGSPRPGVGDIGFGGGNPASNPLNFINPSDIASIDILKDASATAIYGSRGAYGVVIITTKKGRSGQTKIDFNTSYGTSSIMRRIKVLDASQFRQALSYYNLGTANDFKGDVNALDAILRKGKVQNYNIAISGGNETGRYRLSMGVLDQQGIVRKSGIRKYTANLNANFKFLESKKLGLDVNIIPSQYIEDIAPISNDAGAGNSLIGMALTWNPTRPLKIGDSIVNVGGNSIFNPLGVSEAINDKSKVTTVLASISPYYKITDWLEYKILFSINYASGGRRTSRNQRINLNNTNGFTGVGYAAIADRESVTQQITHTLSVDKRLSADLNLSGVVGYEYLKFNNKSSSMGSNGPSGGYGQFGLDYTNYIQYGDKSTYSINSYIEPLVELQSYFARAAFNYKDKYLLTGTIRVDGSTRFGKNNRYGYFPSFAAAWNIGKEDFFKSGSLSTLKFRLGWGKTGNQEFPAGSAVERYGFGSNGTNSGRINYNNPNLKWQSDRQYNAGLDVTLLKNALNITVDYFNKKTTDLLFPVTSDPNGPINASLTWTNIPGAVENKGIEFSANTTIINKKNLGWDFYVNASYITNKVTGLTAPIFTGALNGQGVSGTLVQTIQNGLPINAFWTRNYTGMDKGTGQAVYPNGDIASYQGNPNPKTVLGLGTSLRYEKFNLVINMNGAFGQKLYNNTLNNVINVGNIRGGRNIGLSVYQNPVKESFSNPVTSSSRFIEKGDYLKMSNISLSYGIGNLGKSIRGATIFVTGQNLFVITKFSGFDPEVNTDKGNNYVPSVGIEYQPYPSARTITFGLNFSL